MKNITKIVTLLAVTSSVAHSATLTNGVLTVDIRQDNGAIETVSFGGSDYFNPGTPVSD
jgi:HSP20 family molecular chaperone IbpA